LFNCMLVLFSHFGYNEINIHTYIHTYNFRLIYSYNIVKITMSMCLPTLPKPLSRGVPRAHSLSNKEGLDGHC